MAVFQRVVLLSQGGQGVMGLARAWAHGLNVQLQAVSVANLPVRLRLDSDPDRARQDWNPDPRQAPQPTGLFICGQDVPSVQKKSLLREMNRDGGPALLFCAKAAALPSRILLIDQGGSFSDQLLAITVELCGIFRAGLVVLTVARTEREARERQRRAREILDASLPPHPTLSPQGGGDGAVRVNFDFLAGAEVRSAASVARWRHCQLVVLESNAAWGHWLGFLSGSWITESLESLSFLVIPKELGDMLSRPVNADSSLSARSMPRTRNDESAGPRPQVLAKSEMRSRA